MAAGDATISTLSNVLKTKYDQKAFYQFAYAKSPLQGMMRKDEKFGGNNARITIRYGMPQGGSCTFSVAQGNKSSSVDVGFLLTRKRDYQVAGITGEALVSAEGDENAIFNGLKGEMDGSLKNIARSMAIQAYRNGGGARGKGDGSYSVGTATIQLANPSDITNFEVGMFVQLGSTDGLSGAVRTGGGISHGERRIVGVNRVAGTITLDGNVNTITSASNADYIFRDGDFGLCVSGLLGWLPVSAPTPGDNWYGVDRSVDTVRLAGTFVNGNGGNKEETLIDALAFISREGGELDCTFVNPLDRADIVKSLGTKAVYEPVKSTDGVVGYKALVIEGEDGPVKVISDVTCPRGMFFPLQMDTWVRKSAKPAPRFLDDDGPKFLRESNQDGYEWRIGGYWNIGCEAPGFNGVGQF